VQKKNISHLVRGGRREEEEENLDSNFSSTFEPSETLISRMMLAKTEKEQNLRQSNFFCAHEISKVIRHIFNLVGV
jgi:hypothetical protein